MENKDELKEIDIKNRACYYFDGINQYVDISFSDILLDEKLYENISVYDISYKTSTDPKPLGIRFDKIDGFLRVCGVEFSYLVLIDHQFFDKTCVKYLISAKSGITDGISHNFGKIRINPYDSLSTEKLLTFHNVVILIKSVVNKDQKNCHYNVYF